MRDYKELVGRLRKRIASTTADFSLQGDLLEAADAIEELIVERRGTEEAVKVMQMEIDRLLASRTQKENVESKWIPVTERLPEDKRDVQITVFWHGAWRTMYGYYDGAFWYLYAPMHTRVADVEVIGWTEKPAPMPLPPKEEE